MPPPGSAGVVYCDYCAVPLIADSKSWRARDPEMIDAPSGIDPRWPRLWAGGRRWALGERIAASEASDVFFAQRDHRLTELAVIKIPRTEAARRSAVHEHEVLSQLASSQAPGAAHFSRLVPQPIAAGRARLGLRGDEGERDAFVRRHASGFVHTLADVRDQYPRGIDGTAAVWMLKRISEVLCFVHESGWVHGRLTREHLLVNARDHGVLLIGFSSAERVGERGVDVREDVRQAVAVIAALMGGGIGSSPAPIRSIFEGDPAASAWDLREAVSAAGRAAYGPPRYVPFAMPGWKADASA